MSDLHNHTLRVHVENNDNEGCLLVILFVLLLIFYQLCAISQLLKENIQSSASAEQIQIEEQK